MRNALVVGYGSIGQRHVRILRGMGLTVNVFSRRLLTEEQSYPNLETALSEVNPVYVVIANETSEHNSALKTVLSFDIPQILVEKPLFSTLEQIIPKNLKSQVCVAYNMRFHPLLQRLHSEINEQSVLSVQVYAGQYLPQWRPSYEYQNNYSVNKKLGGGVLRDLSHELDYLSWLLGTWNSLTSIGGHFSSLAGDSDDLFCMLLKMDRCPAVVLQVNYLDRTGRREILINTDHHSYRLDLVNQEFTKDKDEVNSILIDNDETYRAQHIDMLENLGQSCCSFSEGKEVVKMIDFVEKSAISQEWVVN